MIRTTECSVLFRVSCFDMAPSVERMWNWLLQSVKAYVIKLAAHLKASKQTGPFPMCRRCLWILLLRLTSRRRLQDVAVNVCFGVCHPNGHDSPWLWRGVCNKVWLFPLWVTCLSFHLVATPPPSTHLVCFPRKCSFFRTGGLYATISQHKTSPKTKTTCNNLHLMQLLFRSFKTSESQ